MPGFKNRLDDIVVFGEHELRALCVVQPLLAAYTDVGLSVAPARQAVADFPNERPYMDHDGHDDSSAAASPLHSVLSDTTLGVVFCLNAKRADAQALLEAVAHACAPPMALLLQQQWLRRDRFKRALQLELHRTVFQVSFVHFGRHL